MLGKKICSCWTKFKLENCILPCRGIAAELFKIALRGQEPGISCGDLVITNNFTDGDVSCIPHQPLSSTNSAAGSLL